MEQNEDKYLKVALVGPTNVGKSRIFNRMSTSRLAIVCDREGVTVDRNEILITDSHIDIPFYLTDTGGIGRCLKDHPLGEEIQAKAKIAVEAADLVLLCVDGTKEPDSDLYEIVQWLRKQNLSAKIWVLVNKSDCKSCDHNTFYKLGFDTVLPVSAEHGIGFQDLWLNIENQFGSFFSNSEAEENEEEFRSGRVIILGRPNTGKSTLLNAILGTNRSIVADQSGTTRDLVFGKTDIFDFKDIKLVDTAGLRRVGRLDRGVEWVAREKIKRILYKCDLAIIVFDAFEGVTDQDVGIIHMARKMGCSLVFVFNKWDLLKNDSYLEDTLIRSQDLKLAEFSWIPRINTTAIAGKGLKQLKGMIVQLLSQRNTRVATGPLNRFFETQVKHHSHPLLKGHRCAKFYYMSQVDVSPPKFVVSSNVATKDVHFSFSRYVVKSLRNTFGFTGTPIKVDYRHHRKKNILRK